MLRYQFMQNALLASIMASLVCGVIGVIIVERKLVMMSGGIAHTAFGGVGLGYLCGFDPMLGAIGFSVLAALGIGFVRRRNGTKSDVIIALFWSLGMALGVLFVALMPGYPPDLNSYLFGSILSVTRQDLWMMASLSVAALLSIFVYYNGWKAYLFDPQYAQVIGRPTALLEYALLVLVALCVVILIRIVGIILVIALFTAPAACAAFFSRTLEKRIALAIGFSMLFSVGGLFISYGLDCPSGTAIILVAATSYGILWALKAISERQKLKHRVS